MDEAAQEASKELLTNIASWTATDVAEWWNRWYMKAGHKRLGRVMVALGKAATVPTS